MLLLLAALIALPETGVAKVVAAIAQAAQENAARPEPERASGDALADLYLRGACGSGAAAKEVLLGIAYALEPAGVVAKNPLAGQVFQDVESAEQRKARLAAMGTPTLRGRADWLAHFVVSAGLVVIVGAQPAETIGVQKEVSDAVLKEEGSGSGFSFSDLSADLAGIEFARWLAGADPKAALAACAKSFAGADFLPDPKDLADGLTWSEFEAKWGGVKDPRFRAECKLLRTLVQGCKGYAPR